MTVSFEEQVKNATSPGSGRGMSGVQFLVADRNGILYDKCFGQTTIDSTSPPMTPDSIVWLASSTKLFTSLSALQCVEHGLFTLDEDASRLLPELKNTKILSGFSDPETKTEPILTIPNKNITARMLLTHTSGFRYKYFSPDMQAALKALGIEGKDGTTNMNELMRSPILFEPGEGWCYDTSMDWMGLMISRASGMDLAEYFQRNLFAPFGINDTVFAAELTNRSDLREKLMPCTFHNPETGALSTGPFPAIERKDQMGGGGLYGSGRSYFRIMQAVLAEDPRIFRQPETWDLVFAVQVGDEEGGPQKKGPQMINATLLEYEKSCAAILGKENMPKEGIRWGHTLVGCVALNDIPGWIRKGTILWGGAGNNSWWIDRERGFAYWMNTQVHPYAEPKTMVIKGAFMGEMLRRFDKTS